MVLHLSSDTAASDKALRDSIKTSWPNICTRNQTPSMIIPVLS